MGDDIDFQVISAAENSNKFPKKPGFGRKSQFEDVVTLGPREHTPHSYTLFKCSVCFGNFFNFLISKMF